MHFDDVIILIQSTFVAVEFPRILDGVRNIQLRLILYNIELAEAIMRIIRM